MQSNNQFELIELQHFDGVKRPQSHQKKIYVPLSVKNICISPIEM